MAYVSMALMSILVLILARADKDFTKAKENDMRAEAAAFARKTYHYGLAGYSEKGKGLKETGKH